MSEQATVPTTAEIAAMTTTRENAVDSPATAPAAPKDSKALIAKIVAEKAKADSLEAQGVDKADKNSGSGGTGGQTPERGADGKFLPKSAKADAAPKAGVTAKTTDTKIDTPEPPPKQDAGDRSVPDSIARVRRLFNEGKIEEAFQAAFGTSPEAGLTSKQWAAFRADQRKERERVTAREQELGRKEQQLAREIQTAQQEFQPLVHAAKLRDSGDVQGAIEAFMGADINTVQKHLLGAFKNQDPRIAQLQKQIADMQRSAAERQQQDQRAAQEQSVAQAQADYKAGLASELAASANPLIAKVAGKQAFRDAVFRVHQQHYDPISQQLTISHEEAAELAFDELYGDIVDQRERGATTAATSPARAETPAKAGRKATTLNSQEAAEAAPTVKLKGQALIDEIVRRQKAQSAA